MCTRHGACPQVAQLLMDSGAGLDGRTDRGETALQSACGEVRQLDSLLRALDDRARGGGADAAPAANTAPPFGQRPLAQQGMISKPTAV